MRRDVKCEHTASIVPPQGSRTAIVSTGALSTGSTGEEYSFRPGHVKSNSKGRSRATLVLRQVGHRTLAVRCIHHRLHRHPENQIPSIVGRRYIETVP